MLKGLLNKKIILGLGILFLLIFGINIFKSISINNFGNEEKEEVVNINEEVVMSLKSRKILDIKEDKNFTVDLKLSYLTSNIYPSSSFSIEFDKDKLELVDILEGDIVTFSNKTPDWKYDVKSSNKTGIINVIYLDSSGGKDSFTSKSIQSEDKNTIVKLEFKLKNEIKSNDEINLKIKDAVFATIEGDMDNSSLSTKKNTMKIENCKIDIQ